MVSFLEELVLHWVIVHKLRLLIYTLGVTYSDVTSNCTGNRI